MGKLLKAKEDCPHRDHSDQMVLGTVRWEAGPRERQPRALKTKLTQGEPLVLSTLRSNGSHDGQAGGWTVLKVAKGTQGRVGKYL